MTTFKKSKKGSRPKIYCVDIKGNKILKLKQWKTDNPGKIFFDSNYEREAYLLFEKAGFNFEFQPTARELLPATNAFTLSKGKTKKLFRASVRPLTYTMDFLIHCDDGTDVFVEAKGFFTPESRIRYKLFQHSLKSKEIVLLAYDKAYNKDRMHNIKTIIKIIKENFMVHEPQNIIKI